MNGKAVTTISRVLIWSGWLRLAHWMIACGVVFELFSAWAISEGAADPGFWQDWHIMVGQLLAVALLLRTGLLLVPGSSHWRALWPRRASLPAMLQMLKFYLSLARAPLPAWYAHNPLWAPLYLLFYLLLAMQVVSGFVSMSQQVPLELHASGGMLLAAFCVLHVLAVALHDWKGDGALISAMFSGARYFHVKPYDPLQIHSGTPGRSVQVTLDKPPGGKSVSG